MEESKLMPLYSSKTALSAILTNREIMENEFLSITSIGLNI